MEKEIITQAQETQRVPNRINPRQNTPRHILIKLTKIKHKEQILKAAREKQQITHKGIPIKITADLSIETLQAWREWQNILKVMKENNLQPRLLYSVKILISPSYLNEIVAGYSNLGCRLFSFIILSMSCHSLLAWRVSIERSAVNLMEILFPHCGWGCFSLAAFNICSLCLIFVNLINMCLGVFCLGFIHLGLSGFLGLGWLFPSPF